MTDYRKLAEEYLDDLFPPAERALAAALKACDEERQEFKRRWQSTDRVAGELEAEVERLKELLEQAEVDTERKVDAKLRAEIERLREALRKIADAGASIPDWRAQADFARAALESKPTSIRAMLDKEDS